MVFYCWVYYNPHYLIIMTLNPIMTLYPPIVVINKGGRGGGSFLQGGIAEEAGLGQDN